MLNHRDIVSNEQVGVYHTQQQIHALLLPVDYTQEATKADRWARVNFKRLVWVIGV